MCPARQNYVLYMEKVWSLFKGFPLCISDLSHPPSISSGKCGCVLCHLSPFFVSTCCSFLISYSKKQLHSLYSSVQEMHMYSLYCYFSIPYLCHLPFPNGSETVHLLQFRLCSLPLPSSIPRTACTLLSLPSTSAIPQWKCSCTACTLLSLLSTSAILNSPMEVQLHCMYSSVSAVYLCHLKFSNGSASALHVLFCLCCLSLPSSFPNGSAAVLHVLFCLCYLPLPFPMKVQLYSIYSSMLQLPSWYSYVSAA
jgi:hypothetical protein